MIKTINERLRIDKDIVLTKDKSGLSGLLFALRMKIGLDGKSAFELHINRKPNTPKRAIVNKFISEADPKIELSPADFSEEVDSTDLVRQRMRGSKLKGACKKKKGAIIGEMSRTFSILSKKGKTVIYSKRDVALERP